MNFDKKALENALRELSKERPVFHSEADFQHALAWEIHKQVDNFGREARIRLEKRLFLRDVESSESEEEQTHKYVDIFLIDSEGNRIAIELKYATKEAEINVKGEEFKLKTHSAQNLRRYDYLSDLYHIERLVENGEIDYGYAVFLTNDLYYTQKPKYNDVNYYDFSLYDGRKLESGREYRWKNPEKVTKNRQRPLKFNREYELRWQDYSGIEDSKGKYIEFKYLLLETFK